MMKTHDVVQGTPEWLALRAGYFTASEAPAMMGQSENTTRSALLRQKFTGITPAVSEFQQRLFDSGHAAEAATRATAEGFVGASLYPDTGSLMVDSMQLLASFDGITLDESTCWENKLWNEQLAAQVQDGFVPDTHWPQLEQQLLVSGADRVLFTVSDGADCFVSIWYESIPARRAALIAGWKQFKADMAAWQPEEVAAVVVASEPDALPAVFVRVEGRVVAGDMRAHRATVSAWVASLPAKFETDQDFADGVAAVKHCERAEADMKALAMQIRGQMASVDEVFRLIEDSTKEIAAARLRIDKAVKIEKENRKGEIVQRARSDIQRHVYELNARIGINLIQCPDGFVFTEAINGLKSLGSMRDKVSVALANEKIAADRLADTIRSNLESYGLARGHEFLFKDLNALLLNQSQDGFVSIVKQRISQYAADQSEKMEAERERIRSEERAKAERDAIAKSSAVLDAAEKKAEIANSRRLNAEADKRRDERMAREGAAQFDLASEHDEWLAAKAMVARYVGDENCTPARAIVRQAMLIERLRNALVQARAAHVLRTWDDEALVAIDEALAHNAGVTGAEPKAERPR